MFLSAERVEIANEAIRKTFEQSSVAWQAIPHWDTGDRGQSRVRGDVVFPRRPPPSEPEQRGTASRPESEQQEQVEGPLISESIPITDRSVRFRATLGQATAQTPDALLAAVITHSVSLAQKVDADVLGALPQPSDPTVEPPTKPRKILEALLNARGRLEKDGFRAPSCLIASTEQYALLYQLVSDVIIAEDLLKAADVGSLYRAAQLGKDRMVMLGRRQDIAHRCAAAASAGEEPVDLAVSVPPSLEVIGETAPSEIELGVHIRWATRIKDQRGVIPIPLKPDETP